nr:putative cation transporter HKT4 [Agrostis stolonifera]
MHQFSSVVVTLQNLPSHIAIKLSISNFEAIRVSMEKVRHFHEFVSRKLDSLSKCTTNLFRRSYLFLVFQSNPLIVQLVYFMSISFAGFLALKNLKSPNKPTPRNLDLMFTAVSTVTVSSMATVEMEDFSDQQLWVLIILMILGGEMFMSMLGLHFRNARANTDDALQRGLAFISRDIESSGVSNNSIQDNMEGTQSEATMTHNQIQEHKEVIQNSRNILARVLAGYFIASIACGSVVIVIYLLIDSDTRDILKSKDIKMWTFSAFTAISSFANCGFTPVNDNMAIFRNKPTFLLLVMPQILVGNTLFAPLLRLSLWVLGKVSKREEYAYILQHPEEIGYKHLQTNKNSVYLVLTGVLLILLQAMFLCYFESDSNALKGMKWFQKLVASVFQGASSRHAGETVIDISTLSPPILLAFAVVMYLPSGTSFLATCGDSQTMTDKKENLNSRATWGNFVITKPACLAIFTILACITERKSMSADPLNFSIFSVIFEVIRQVDIFKQNFLSIVEVTYD